MTGDRMLNHLPGEVRLLKLHTLGVVKEWLRSSALYTVGNSAEVMTVKLFQEVEGIYSKPPVN